MFIIWKLTNEVLIVSLSQQWEWMEHKWSLNLLEISTSLADFFIEDFPNINWATLYNYYNLNFLKNLIAFHITWDILTSSQFNKIQIQVTHKTN